MTDLDKLVAILAAVQVDPGNRGLATVPGNNLFTATATDFQAACHSLAVHPNLIPLVVTGFIIPSVSPPRFETDGPLGAVFLVRAFVELKVWAKFATDPGCYGAVIRGIIESGIPHHWVQKNGRDDNDLLIDNISPEGRDVGGVTHVISIERPGPAADGRCRTMRGRDITDLMLPATHLFSQDDDTPRGWETIGIGDGGNEIGMGKVPHETVLANVPNGDAIHCRVPTDHLIVAGVSNWGAYALAAGLFVLLQMRPTIDLFDPDREKRILESMVRAGPLIDGVTGKKTATVDGLTWDEYVKPLVRIREILAL
ncbi:glutamate cyclase domain-containing protein [Limnoglobus roseus]|uniref:D-glutamate cyclase-like C-terminal domain-containing protein n=1 Tax=Limnoglobus roseus TaxID=2598579 RepID=A0A5C1AKU0_9BACT|nr:glutamate cyclase domain-containing protein [Limnoglobus roseus]QEL19530.1 hypothetical protein PX52LOC_06605 [Limnoglobus roseus]